MTLLVPPEPMLYPRSGVQIPQGPTLPARRSHTVLSAYGLNSFVGLLSLDGTLQDSNLSASPAPELSGCDALGHPFWDAAWWDWSPLVQQRLRTAVIRVAAGRVIRYNDTALVRRNQLITVDLAWAPVVRRGSVTALICSVIDITGDRRSAAAGAGASLTRSRPTSPAPGVMARSWVEGVPV